MIYYPNKIIGENDIFKLERLSEYIFVKENNENFIVLSFKGISIVYDKFLSTIILHSRINFLILDIFSELLDCDFISQKTLYAAMEKGGYYEC